MAYITCKKCGETYDYPEGESPSKCVSCGAPFFNLNEQSKGVKSAMNRIAKPNFNLTNGTEITSVKISVKDFFFLYVNALIAALPFLAVILIIYLLYQLFTMK